jgi:hypothetical protein
LAKGKGPIKRPVTETKLKFDRLLFAVQGNQKDKLLATKVKFDRLLFPIQKNQQDKLVAITHAAIDRAQNFANSLDIEKFQRQTVASNEAR